MEKVRGRKNKVIIGIICGVLALLFLFGIWIIVENNIFTVKRYTVPSEKIGNGITVVQISDLHNKSFGKHNKRLADEIKKISPDLIVFTGDTVDSEKNENSLALIREISALAPTFLSIGNHEAALDYKVFSDFCAKVEECGAKVLDNEVLSLTLDGNDINLAAISDPNAFALSEKGAALDAKIKELSEDLDGNNFTLALSHRPEYFDIYTSYPLDLTLAGHAHGGQWRLFGLAGYATGQGLFPKLTSGLHTKNNRGMIISRGLGNGKPIPRIFNIPELVVINLTNGKV